MVKRFGITQVLFRILPLGDILDCSFVIKQYPLAVTHGTTVFRNPDDGAIFAINLRLKPTQSVLLLHQAHKVIAPSFLHVESAANIGEILHQFFRGVIAVNTSQSSVGHHIFSIGSGLKNTFHQVVEHAVVLLLGFEQRAIHPPALDSVA